MYYSTQPINYSPTGPTTRMGAVLGTLIPIGLAAFGWLSLGCSAPKYTVGVEQKKPIEHILIDNQTDSRESNRKSIEDALRLVK